MASIFVLFVLCWPVFAQNQSKAALEVGDCIKRANFYPSAFIQIKEIFVAERVRKYINCLDKTSNPQDPEIQYARGFAYKFEAPRPGQEYLKNARAEFCAAAEQGYVRAQEQCAFFSSEDKKAEYKWTLAAALNGSGSAQMSLSINAWGDAIKNEDHDYNNYLVNYLACHPAMLRESCGAVADSDECREGMKELAIEQLSNIAQCQKELNQAIFDNTESSKRKEWEQLASNQLKETLENIRQQVRLYPGLVKLQTIEP
jgi:hypothetical protein